jgi:predicted RNase H-like nuclease
MAEIEKMERLIKIKREIIAMTMQEISDLQDVIDATKRARIDEEAITGCETGQR